MEWLEFDPPLHEQGHDRGFVTDDGRSHPHPGSGLLVEIAALEKGLEGARRGGTPKDKRAGTGVEGVGV